jgi:hypothetical protein
VYARLRGANCAAAIARRDLRGAICAARFARRDLRGAVELISDVKLISGARRGCGEQALVNPGIAIFVDFDIHLVVIHVAFLLVFVFAGVGVLHWLFPGVAFVFF